MKKLFILIPILLLSEFLALAQKHDTLHIQGITVEGTVLKENQKVGIYQQPEWTTERRFSTTRIYLQQTPGTWGVEQWVKAQYPKGEMPNFLFQEEVEVGLPGRLQLDIYENWIQTPEGKIFHDNVSLELRWALAKWGKIPFNPTLYFEWKFKNHSLGDDAYEMKLLLGKDFGKRWHYGINLFYEQEIAGMLTTEMGVSQGLSYTLKDKVLSLGAELKIESETEKTNRKNPPVEIDLGPSLQWRPIENIHIDMVPLLGLNSDSPQVEAWFILGYDFGKREGKTIHAPVTNQSH